MALYAIGDFHLSFQVHKPMDVFGSEWKDHVKKIKENWIDIVRPEDTAVITGDHSWGRNLEECREDLEFIAALPGLSLIHILPVTFWRSQESEKTHFPEFLQRWETFRGLMMLRRYKN